MIFAIRIGLQALARTCATTTVLLAFLLPQASAETFQNATIVQHEQAPTNEYSDHLTLSWGNHTEHLLLNRSQVFTDLTVTDSAGNVLLNHTESGRRSHYEGKVADVADSWVRLTIDEGLVSGIIDTGRNRLYLESGRIASGPRQQIREAMQLSRSIDHSIYPPDPNPAQIRRRIQEVVALDVNSSFLNQPGVISRVIKVGIVIDSRYDEAVGGHGFNKAVSTINAVDGLYREHFGLALKVDRAVVLTDDQTLPLGSISLDENLALFREFRMHTAELDNDLGLVHLFTGATATPRASVGLAYIGAACRTDGYDVSMSLPFRYPSLLAAHEIGHNLGASHDDETEICSFETGKLMHSDINGSTSEEFSSCSRDAITNRLEKNTCFYSAIDLDLKLLREEGGKVTAVVTNTDLQRAFPAATLTIDLKNATVAAAPASCQIEGPTQLTCAVTSTLANSSQNFAFDFRLDSDLEISIHAALKPEGFFDVQTFNNSAEIVIASVESPTNSNLVIATSEDPATASAVTIPDSPVSDGGGSLTKSEVGGLLLLAVFLTHRRPHRRLSARVV